MVEPPVDNPQLRALVELAQAQPDPILRTTMSDVREGVSRQQSRVRRGWAYGGVLAAAAAVVAWFAIGPATTALDASGRDSGVAAERTVDGQAREGAASVVDASPVPRSPAGVVAPSPVPSDAPADPNGAADAPSVPADGQLSAGDPTGEQSTLESPTDDVADDSEAADAAPPKAVDKPSAAALSSQAEAALVRGDRSDAIRILSKLARTYPRATQTGAGLVDLGRLLRQSGRVDRARCAYQAYLDRFPSAALRPEVERELAKLGAGPDCRGLRPR